MSRSRPNSHKNRDPYALAQSPQLNDFWNEQIRMLGRNLFFVETGFVVASFDPSTRAAAEALLKEIVTGCLVTSSYVIAEAVRRIVKSKTFQFRGPQGEQRTDLAVHFLVEWLKERNVKTICPPECVFEEAIRIFRQTRAVGCDLADVLSFVLVKGLEQNRILSQDGHFRSLGLTTMLQL